MIPGIVRVERSGAPTWGGSLWAEAKIRADENGE